MDQAFPAAPAEVFALFTDRDFLEQRMVDGGGIDPTVLSIDRGDGEDGGDTTTVVTQQAIPASALPSMVASMMPGDPVTERTERWKPDGDGFVAEFTVTVKGAPASLTGTMTLCRAPDASDQAATTLKVEGQATVPIPMFGPKIEGVIVEQIGGLLTAESHYTRRRLEG
jgi:uncharacterized protein YndB with AHSA1/START domain